MFPIWRKFFHGSSPHQWLLNSLPMVYKAPRVCPQYSCPSLLLQHVWLFPIPCLDAWIPVPTPLTLPPVFTWLTLIIPRSRLKHYPPREAFPDPPRNTSPLCVFCGPSIALLLSCTQLIIVYSMSVCLTSHQNLWESRNQVHLTCYYIPGHKHST